MPYLCRMQKASVRNEELKEQWETLVSVLGTNFPYPVRLEFQNVAMVLMLLLVLGGLASAWATAQVGKRIKLL